MSEGSKGKLNLLFVFGGEKAQGAEIVIERLMHYNADEFNIHLLLSPGDFANKLVNSNAPYKIQILPDLKKLNRSSTGKLQFYSQALRNYFSISAKIGQYINANSIDVVHANTLVPAAYLIPLIASRRLLKSRIKWLWSDHDMVYFSKMENRLSAMCFKLYDATLLVSGALKRKYNRSSPKLIVLYNGLDTDHFRKDEQQRNLFREKWNFTPSQIVIAIAGSINPDKGQLELINVFKILSAKYPQIRLVLAGTYAAHFPEYQEEIEAGIKGQQAITYIGFTSQTNELYNGCDIIVNNSNNARSESLGTTIYEAMACEKIVLASRTGGTPEIIEDNTEGFLFETENEAELGIRLAYVIENLASLDQIKRNAREKVLRVFNILVMSRKYREVIARITND